MSSKNSNNNSKKDKTEIIDVSQNETVIPKKDKDSRPRIYIKTLNIFTTPFKRRYEKHYENSKKHFVFDLILALLVFILIVINILLITAKIQIPNIKVPEHTPSISSQTNNNQGQNNNSEQKSQLKNTSLKASLNTLYYTAEGEQLGVGPWPPQVNATTTLFVKLELNTNLRQANNIKALINLGDRVKYKQKFAVNQGLPLSYDFEKKQLNWHIENLNPESSARASIELELTPNEQTINQKIILVKSVFVSGQDSFTGENISASQGQLSTPAVKENK